MCTTSKMKIDSAPITNLREAGLTIYERCGELGSQKCPLSLSSCVRIKQVDFRENL